MYSLVLFHCIKKLTEMCAKNTEFIVTIKIILHLMSNTILENYFLKIFQILHYYYKDIFIENATKIHKFINKFVRKCFVLSRICHYKNSQNDQRKTSVKSIIFRLTLCICSQIFTWRAHAYACVRCVSASVRKNAPMLVNETVIVASTRTRVRKVISMTQSVPLTLVTTRNLQALSREIVELHRALSFFVFFS